MKKAKFITHLLGSYGSSNRFPYGFTLLAGDDCIDWGDETPKHPSDIEKIGEFKVIQRDCVHRPAYDWGYGGYEAHDAYEIIMVDDRQQYLILQWHVSDPSQWRPVPAEAAQINLQA